MRSIFAKLAAVFLFAGTLAFGQGAQLPKYRVSTLPSASAYPTYVVQVVDGSTTSDCTSGGGGYNVICVAHGGAWGPITSSVSGLVTPANGGTGVVNPTGYAYGNGTSNFSFSTTIPWSVISSAPTIPTTASWPNGGVCGAGLYMNGHNNGNPPNCAQVQYSQLGGTVPTWNQSTTGNAAGFTGSLAGDVTGTQGATTVGKLQGIALPTLTGVATGILYDTSGTLSLQSTLPSAAMPTLSGDVSNSGTSLTVLGLNGTVLSTLTTGLLKVTNGTGAISTAGPNVDYVTPSGNITGTSSGFTGSLAGDVTGTQGATTVGKLRGIALPTLAASTGLFYDNNGTLSLTTAPAVSAANMTSFPTLNQNTTGTAGGLTGTPSISITNLTASGTITMTGIKPASGANCLQVSSTGSVTNTGLPCGSGSGMVYPTAGVAISTGSAWGTSLPLAGSGAGVTSGPTTSTSGDIATFSSTTGQIQDSGTNISVIPTLAPLASPTFTGSVGIDKAAYSGIPLDVSLNTSASTAPYAGTGAALGRFTSNDGVVGALEVDAYGNYGTLFGIRADGTKAAPTAVQSGDVMFRLAGSGYNGASYVSGLNAAISLAATENWTSTANGSELQFAIQPKGNSGTAANFMYLCTSNGNLQGVLDIDNHLCGANALEVGTSGQFTVGLNGAVTTSAQFNGPGTGLTGTASSLTAGAAAAISSSGTANQVWGMNSAGTAQGWQTVSGGGGTTTNAVTFSNNGTGGASGSTFNGASALTVSYNTLGAAPLASPAFTGTPTAPTATAGTNTTQVATTAFVATSFAPLASPTFTGTPSAPTPSGSDSSTKLATTAFVQNNFANINGASFSGTINAPGANISTMTVHGFIGGYGTFLTYGTAAGTGGSGSCYTGFICTTHGGAFQFTFGSSPSPGVVFNVDTGNTMTGFPNCSMTDFSGNVNMNTWGLIWNPSNSTSRVLTLYWGGGGTAPVAGQVFQFSYVCN